MKKLKSGIVLYETIPVELRLRYSNRNDLEKGKTYIVEGVGKIPLRDGNSYDAVVLSDGDGTEAYLSIPVFLGIALYQENGSWKREIVPNGGVNDVAALELLIGKTVKVKEFVNRNVTNFRGETVERQFPVWKVE